MPKFPPNFPSKQKAELARIVEHIQKLMKVEFIILFGSFARGTFVEHDETFVEGHTEIYESDFDLLAIVKNETRERDSKIWGRVNNQIERDPQIKTRVDLIVENIKHVNEQLVLGRYFFCDLKKEGLLLYDSGKFKLAKPKKLTPKQRKKLAEEDFEEWFKKAKRSYKQYDYAFNDHYNLKDKLDIRQCLNKAAFELHQTTEFLYSAIQLVFTTYKPKVHDLETLAQNVEILNVRFKVFQRSRGEGKRLFELLRQAYVDARYKKAYRITPAELKILATRVRKLMRVTEEVCEEYLGKIGR